MNKPNWIICLPFTKTSHKNKTHIKKKLLNGYEITGTNVTAFESETTKMEHFDDNQ